MRTLSLVVIGVMTIGTPSSLLCQQREGKSVDTPESVAHKALIALREDRLQDYAELMHPDALKRFRSMVISSVQELEREGLGNTALAMYGLTKEQLKRLNDRELFVATLKGVYQRVPELKQVTTGAEFQVLGHVMEGSDTAHVVYRLTATLQGIKASKISVITLQRSSVGWRMLLLYELENMLRLLSVKSRR